MATTTEDVTKQRLEYRIPRSIEERQVDATELIADTLESIKSEITDMNLLLTMIANKE